MQLEEKLYTSTEVAEILGVSLRSVYRYLDEGKLQAEVKTATGRHRFTKQNILDFLYPQNQTSQTNIPQPKKETSAQIAAEFIKEEIATQNETQKNEMVEEEKKVPEQEMVTVEEEKQEEPIDWLEKFRAAASKYREEEMKKEDTPVKTADVAPQASDTFSGLADFSQPAAEEAQPVEEDKSNFYYYRSLSGGLKDIAQNIDKSARKAAIEYAFTMNAGLSLHKPIKPFSLLHVYIRPEDREFFERMLHLVPAEENNAQLCLMVSTDNSVFGSKKEMHGLMVVSDDQLRQDLQTFGDTSLLDEFDSIN